MLYQRLLLSFRYVFLFACCWSLMAQSGSWINLGNSHIDGANDHDTIKVGANKGNFRAIQLRVSGGTVFFQRVVARYGNGSQQDIPVRFAIKSGGRTRAIILPGIQRVLDSVDIWYSKSRWATRPRVTLYGIR